MRKKPKTTVSTHALVLMFYDLGGASVAGGHNDFRAVECGV